ncbi:pentraxin fusion protein-like isoform X1 [Ptychodera flava]|uniref:pentraxin fusion protein-like isoform X1 n=1 Tax=Ptychodera flava TaxID=63121 RepID=UPI003969F08D
MLWCFTECKISVTIIRWIVMKSCTMNAVFFFGIAVFCRVFGTQTENENLALNKEASQSSTYEIGEASKAVDGMKNNNDYHAGSCSHTDHQYNAWWKVDLDQMYLITRIDITNREDCCGERLKGAVVRVGKEMTITHNRMCGAALTLNQVYPNPVTVDCGGWTGRFVSVQLEGYNTSLTLCEVEVYGHKDTENPSISCPADVNKTANVETPSVAVHWPLPNATDNSGDVSISGSNHPGSNFTVGTTVVSYEASDPSGNNASCSFIVRVKGTVLIKFIYKSDLRD